MPRSPRAIVFARGTSSTRLVRDGAAALTVKRRCSASAYRRSLEIAEENGLASIAFPAISTGVFAYPLRAACEIAVRTVLDWQSEHALPSRVVLCAFDESTEEVTRRALHSELARRAAP